MMGNFFMIFFRLFPTFQNQLSKCQTVWIQIRTDILSVLIRVQTVCKGYQHTTKSPLAGRVKLLFDTGLITLKKNLKIFLVVCQLFKIYFFKKFFQSVKQFGSRSGPTFCWSLAHNKITAGRKRIKLLADTGLITLKYILQNSPLHQGLLCFSTLCMLGNF